MSAISPSDVVGSKLEQMLQPNHVLCKNDMVWFMEFVKSRVYANDPRLLELPPERLLQNFRHYAEIALTLIYNHPGETETERLRTCLTEAVYGLLPTDTRSSQSITL
ncbi:hypothetical protein DUZ99_04180 [Xylanibacillus composti]|uniref:Uncharacterized protein n=1 Tax=Xylanibacillus composti TaxID=1572762 RepID=A0A8J4M1Q1_9BACL|nr:hypothetical protein [Xylanibacillus composti]MDT9724185.1 hypothetical protein [Xylanibacillus composti]GIQ68300.1 hypothetical protein XYCOK13_11240 [Xylanibacillus composti]